MSETEPLPGQRPSRSSTSFGYVAAYIVTLACFVVVWFRHRFVFSIGRDTDLSLWLGKAYLDWAAPLDVTAMNPLQGMTSMLMAINPYFNPAAWVFQTGLPEMLKLVAAFVVYFFEVTLSTFALGVALGFSRPFSFVAALWLAFLLFPRSISSLACKVGSVPPRSTAIRWRSIICCSLRSSESGLQQLRISVLSPCFSAIGCLRVASFFCCCSSFSRRRSTMADC